MSLDLPKFDPTKVIAPPQGGDALARSRQALRKAAVAQVLGKDTASKMASSLAGRSLAERMGKQMKLDQTRVLAASRIAKPTFAPLNTRMHTGIAGIGASGSLADRAGIGAAPRETQADAMESVNRAARELADAVAAERRTEAERDTRLLDEMQGMRAAVEGERKRADEAEAREMADRERSEAREEQLVKFARRSVIVGVLGVIAAAISSGYLLLS
jgi:hypothetical protein